MNRINLSKYNLRTDLALDLIDNKEITKIREIKKHKIKISTLNIDKSLSKKLNKKSGNYITIEFDDVTNYEDRECLGKTLEEEVKKILNIKKIKDSDSCLIVGLGNNNSTPDALGPKTIENVLVTRHLFLLNTIIKDGIREVSAFSPGVMGNTGIETSNLIKNVIEDVKPKFIIVIDALASLSIGRLNKTIQLTDTGIHPGSGIGNNRKEISEDIYNIPVIAIGVPTVVESSTIVNDSLNYLFKHIYYIKNNFDKNKLILSRTNYLNKINKLDLPKEEKEKISGLLGTLEEKEKKSLFNEVLNSLNYNLIVTPKEIDFLINKFSDIISSSLNNALHRQITHY